MKRVILIAATLVVTTAAADAARATEVGSSRRIGFGLQIIEPTAAIGKVYLDRNRAIDFGFGFWGYGRCYDAGHGNRYCNDYYAAYSLHLDFLFEDTIVENVVRLSWHVGLGGRTQFGNKYYFDDRYHRLGMFARVPVGLDLAFRRPEFLEVYLEVAPGTWLYPGLTFDIDVGLGVRAYF